MNIFGLIPFVYLGTETIKMDNNKKEAWYKRIYAQIAELTHPIDNPIAKMSTIIALLHHKLDYFFWTGFYLLDNDCLTVGPYQGSLACLTLKKNTGVCWAGINGMQTIIVADVEKFPGHIACSSSTQSEIVVPLLKDKKVIGVLDVDSKALNSFDRTDAVWLEKIVQLIYS